MVTLKMITETVLDIVPLELADTAAKKNNSKTNIKIKCKPL